MRKLFFKLKKWACYIVARRTFLRQGYTKEQAAQIAKNVVNFKFGEL